MQDKVDLNWLAPAFDDAKSPLVVPDAWIRKVAMAMSAYILLFIYPAYVGLRYFWAGIEPTWESLAVAGGVAILFGLFAARTMSRYFHIRKKN